MDLRHMDGQWRRRGDEQVVIRNISRHQRRMGMRGEY